MKKFQWREKSKKLTNIFITSAFLATQLLVPIAFSGTAHAAPGDNGDVKTHNASTSTDNAKDEPKVCVFYLDAFNFDTLQSVDWHIVTDTHGDTVLNGSLSLTDGHGYTQNYTLPEGMYKLYWNFEGENGSDKHKVFKVDCTKVEPSLTTQASQSTVKVGDKVHDTATVAGVTDNGVVSGGVNFYICKSTTGSYPDCSSGGAGSAVGSAVAVTNGSAVSSDYTVTATGKYCFRATYHPDTTVFYNQVSHTNLTTECFEATANTPPPTPAKPTFSVDKLACVVNSGNTDQVKVTVTNTADDTHASATYTVTVGVTTKTTAAIADGQSETLTFSGLAAGNYTVGVSGNDGTSATSAQVTVAVCPKPVIKPCTTSTGTTNVTKDDVQGFDFAETRATGHYGFTQDGLHVWTESNTSTDKVAAYKNVNVALSDVGTTDFSYTKIGGDPNVAPGYQLYIDNGKTGAAHVAGYVVHEPDYYGNNWWSNKDFGVGAGGGYTSYAPLSDYLAANPDARVYQFGFSLGSGVKGDGTLQDIQFNCHTWHFTKPGGQGGGETQVPQTPPTQPGTQDVGQVLGISTVAVTPVVAVATPTVTSSELANTGQSSLISVMAGLMVITLAIGSTFAVRRRYDN